MSDYYNFIEKKGKKKKENNYHKHHIIPKSQGGTDDKSNIVWLTVQDHAWSHILYDLEHGTRTSLMFLGMIWGNTGIRIPIENITYEDCGFLNDYEDDRKEIISQTQREYWSDPEKKEYRRKQLSEAKIGKVNVCVNTKWVNKDGVRRRVPKDEVDLWLSKGFKLGEIIRD